MPKHHPSDYAGFKSRSGRGYIYAINNPAWPEWIKIGKAVDITTRCGSFNTASPFRDYEVIYSIVIDNNYTKVEEEAHKLAEELAQERRHEWFKITVQEAKNVLQSIEPKSIDRS